MRRSRRRKTGEIKRVVLYMRVSTPGQAEKDLSLPAQLDALKNYCKQKGYIIVGEYEEPGASGTDDNRPVFRRMLMDVLAPSSEIDAVLVVYLSRFMRNATRSRIVKEKLAKAGVRVVAITQEVSDDPSGHLMEAVFEAFDQFESEMNGLRTKAALRENAKRGYFNGSRPPFGFKIEKVEVKPELWRGKLVPNPDEVPIVREVIQAYITQTGAKAAAGDLNQRGFRYRGKLFSKDLVFKIVDETAAIGTYHWGKVNFKTNTWNPEEEWIAIPTDPIIEKELFEMGRRVRQERDPIRSPGRTASSPLLLAGLVKCGNCGQSFQVETSGKQTEAGVYKYRYYNCRGFLRTGKDACPGQRISTDKLETAVLEHIADRIFTAERCREILRDAVEEVGLIKQKTAAHRQSLQQELEEVEKGITNWECAFEKGMFDSQDEAERYRYMIGRRTELRETLAKVVPMKPPAHLYTPATIEKFQRSLREVFLGEDRALAKSYLRFLVDKIVISPGGQVEIHAKSHAALKMLQASGKAKRKGEPEDSPFDSPTIVGNRLG
ncbi:MAG: recombinase family protein [Deltaproteobacteria bacterium]|nr:recombinase family protein [Deltaproteobacteria bacterium]